MRCKLWLITGIVSVLSTVLLADDKTFSLYGFMDGKISKSFLPDNTLMKSLGMTEDVKMTLNHINLYFDLKPNSHIRSLVEIAFQSSPLDLDPGVTGRDLKLTARSFTLRDTALVVASKAGKNTTLPGTKGEMEINEWGSLSVERAWMEYSFNQYFNLLYGKFITPAGIWNVDHGSPVILTVRQPFETGVVQIFPKSQIGLMESGRIFMGDADLEYSLYASTGRDQINLENAKDLAGGGHLRLSLPLLDELKIGFSGYTGMQKQSLTTQNITVDVSDKLAQFTYEAAIALGKDYTNPAIAKDPAVAALVQKKLAAFMASSEGQERLYNPDNTTYTTVEKVLSREKAIGGDFRATFKGFTLQSEVNILFINNFLKDNALTQTIGYYFLGSYCLRPTNYLTITPYLMYEHILATDCDNNPQFILSGETFGREETFIGGFNNYLFGLNIKLNTNYTLKLEYGYGDLVTTGPAVNYQDIMDIGYFSAQFSVAF